MQDSVIGAANVITSHAQTWLMFSVLSTRKLDYRLYQFVDGLYDMCIIFQSKIQHISMILQMKMLHVAKYIK